MERALLLLVVWLPGVAMAALFGELFAGTRPSHVGSGTLAPCPETPNCVSSQARDAGHAIAPVAYGRLAGDALERLAGLAAAMPGARRVAARTGYVHLEFVSAMMGFVDDVELVDDPAAGVIHVRSASRLGRSDFGVNRRRVEELRAAFAIASR